MAISLILIFRKIKADGKFYQKVLLPVSKASYDMYLMHLLILVPICGLFRNLLGTGEDGIFGFWTTPVEILASAIISFIITAAISVIMRYLFKFTSNRLK